MQRKEWTVPLAVKTLKEDGTFYGYASVFGKTDLHNEIVAPGAFQRSLNKWRRQTLMPAMLWMHDPTTPIGLWIDLAEDQSGLFVTGKLALGTQKGVEAYELVKMRALTGLSIGYRVVSSRVDSKRKARVLTDLDLFEISLVTFPANEAARIEGVKAPRTEGLANDDDALTRAIVARLREAASSLQKRSMD